MSLRFLTYFCICSIVALQGQARNGPTDALNPMKVADGFESTLVASEPDIRQPLSITFDDRGRMWVIQYLQYPAPAGLKAVKVDQYLRTTYDRVPEPPPHGPKGVDRITICEDTNGDGKMDRFKEFVTGLNLCSGMALGYGGVFVVQPPYLIFYADKNQDDIPDSDPEVLLSGFGMEDAHAFANSLTWGPDGWLYGAQGSTVTAKIRGIEFQQGIWRYHPITREFELFAEGGGNTWGVDFDEEGEIIAGTNFNEKMLHQVQGAYYVKNFGKHGALHNLYTYGYFDHVPYSGYQGKHISIGGVFYRGGAFPKEFNNTYIFGNALDHAVYWANRQRNGSTFTSSFGGTLLKTDDELFRPVDCIIGPDGAVYVADWCDKRATHVDPLDTWDRSNGRIYRIQWKQAKPTSPFDLAKLPSDKLVDELSNANDWYARIARRLLAERRDEKIIPRLTQQVFESKDARLQLQSLWALYVSDGELQPQLARKLLSHDNPAVVMWTVRLLGDERKLSPAIQFTIRSVATNPSPAVVRQLASSAKRLPVHDAFPILDQLLRRGDLANDPFIPLLTWWALEDKAVPHRDAVLKLFSDEQLWKSALVQQHILERLARRFTDEGGTADFLTCAELLKVASNLQLAPGIGPQVESLLTGMDKSLVGKSVVSIPPPLQEWITKAWKDNPTHSRLLRLGLRFNQPSARDTALQRISNETVPEAQRVELIEVLGQTGNNELSSRFLEVLEKTGNRNVRVALISALRSFHVESLAGKLLELYPGFDDEMRSQTRSVLISRPQWASAFVSAVETGKVDAKEVPLDQVRTMASFEDKELNKRLQKLWGKIQANSPAELQSTINKIKLVLKPSGVAGRDASGNPDEGKKVYEQICAVCHKLYGEGSSIGPDLTTIDRKDISLLLENIVNPSGYIRTEFMSHEVETRDEQIFSGIVVESTANAVTILDRNNQRHTIARERIAELKESSISLMPEGLLEALSPQQVMDLFSYLQNR
jgi:putative membrane-bound dehydrogenase-like protein